METLLFVLAGLPCLLLLCGLLPMKALRLQLGVLLAADTTTLAPVTANKIVPIIAPFTPGENLVVGDLTLGSTNGLTPISCATGAQEVAIDPVTQSQIVTIIPGAGTGFRWVTSGTFPPAITVYGYALTDNGGTVLLAVQKLGTPIVMTAVGYQLDVDPVQMTFVLSPLS